MTEGTSAGDPSEQHQPDQGSEGSEHVDVTVPTGHEIVVSTDVGSEIPPQQRIESQLEPIQEYTVPDGSTEDEVTVSVQDTDAGSSDQSQEDTNPEAPRVDGANYVQDESKAETMAYEETDFRSKAVANRKISDGSEEYGGKLDEIHQLDDKLYHKPPQQFSGLQRLKMMSKRAKAGEELYHIGNDDERRTEDERDTAQKTFRQDFPDFNEQPLSLADKIIITESDQERAAYYDKQASRIGDWAGLLHDHPLSAEFKKAHPGIQFQPKRLVRMEDEVEALQHQIENKEQVHTDIMSMHIRKAFEGRENIGLQRLVRRTSSEKANEYEDRVQALLRSAEALDEFRDGLIEEQVTEPLRDRLVMTRNVLNDVRREVGLPFESDESEDAASSYQPQAE